MLAGAPAMPSMTAVVGKWAVDQGRISEGPDTSHAFADPADGDPATSPSRTGSLSLVNSPVKQGFEEETEDAETESLPPKSASLESPLLLPGFEDLPKASLAAQTNPSLLLYGPKPRSARTMDPFGQLDEPTPASSTPSIPLRPPPNRASTAPVSPLTKYDPLYQQRLLRSHYSKSEVNFLQGLESISNRLLIVPKPARVCFYHHS